MRRLFSLSEHSRVENMLPDPHDFKKVEIFVLRIY